MITNVPCVCVPVASSADKVDVFNANVGDTCTRHSIYRSDAVWDAQRG